MSEDPLSLQPQIIQFNNQQKQLLKITNRTSQTITNCFFCLFNNSKYQFSPQSFKLQPKQCKIVQVTLLNKFSQYRNKQYAYLKSSKNCSKRITFIYNSIQNQSVSNNQEKMMMRSPSSGMDQLYTLSSRDYRETQKAAYDRLIAEKQMYIKRLQRRLEQQQQSNRKDRSFTSQGKIKNTHLKQIQHLQQSLSIVQKQKQSITQQNRQLRMKVKDLQLLLIKGSNKNQQLQQIEKIISRKEQAISKLKQDLSYFENQCQSLYVTIAEKQEKIRKYQQKNSEIINQLMMENEKKLKELEGKIDEDRKKSQRESKNYKQKIKKLEDKLSQSQISNNIKIQLQHQISEKSVEVSRLMSKLQQQKKNKKQYEQQKKKSIKTHLRNQSLLQQNDILKSKVQKLEKSLQQLKQQTIIYRSKVTDQQSQKASRYLQVALQSCRNQNQILKKSKKQVQQILNDQVKNRKVWQNKNRELEHNITKLNQQVQHLKFQKQRSEENGRISRDESHETIMKLRSENISLIQKMSFGHKKDQSYDKQLKQSQIKLQRSQQQFKKIKQQSDQIFQKLKQAQDQKLKMSRKIQKYKKQTTKQLKQITQNTLDELKKIKQQKKKQTQKIIELQKQINDYRQRQKLNINTRIDSTLQNLNDKHQAKTRYPATQSDRRTGIKNQKKQIQQTINSCTRNQQLQHLYGQLGQLRQFKNYISLQMKKMKNLFTSKDNCSDFQQNQNLIFSCVSIFDTLRFKLSDQAVDRNKLLQTQKQLFYLRGRLLQLQNVSKAPKINNDNTLQDKFSAIELNRNEGDRQLLQIVRQEMKNQYKKLHDSLLISQQKFQILKKKIYEQYRSRIISLINSKQKTESTGKLLKIQSVLQRFVQGLANKSHKQAILSKQVRLKQEARKQVGSLKQKVGFLNHIIETKKTYCTRQPVKVFGCLNDSQWHDNIRLQARMLTYEAENTRLLQQLSLYQSQNRSLQQQMKQYFDEIQQKQNQITRLKKQVVQIQSLNAKQLLKRQQDIDQLQKRFFKAQEQSFNSENKISQEKQLSSMKAEIQRKKQIIKNLKEKQKLLQQIIESNRSSQTFRSNTKFKKQNLEDVRLQQSLKQFRQNNRELRNQNNKLKQENLRMKEEIQKKNVTIKRYKGEGEQSRIKAFKSQSQQIEKLRRQNRQLNDDLKIMGSDFDKLKKKREKQLLELESEIKKLKNQNIIEKRSLQSVIRALCDSIRRLYSDIDILARKRGLKAKKQINFSEILEKPGQIDSIKVYEAFQELLVSFKS